jgi:hypothetical protein
MVSPSVYLWSLRPEAGLAIEIRITAESAASARREVHRFLAEHDGATWEVECIAREARVAHGEFASMFGRVAASELPPAT